MNDDMDKWYGFSRDDRPLHAGGPAGRRVRNPLDYLVPLLLVSIFAAIGILGWQVYSYLRYGEWSALSAIVVLRWLNVGWAHSPRDWVGLHDLLDAIPLSMIALAAGVVPIGSWLWWEKRINADQNVDFGE